MNLHNKLTAAYINKLIEFLVSATLYYEKKGSH